nr:acid phosphatase/vanadium-dependent haloperoxidas proteine-related [Tanacetum cinerariifolium]
YVRVSVSRCVYINFNIYTYVVDLQAMYDETSEGLHAGRQAEVLKQIVFELRAEHPLAESRPLCELLG